MTPILPVACRGLVAPEGKPLENSFGALVRSHLLCTKGETVMSCHLLLACPSLASPLTPEARPCLKISATLQDTGFFHMGVEIFFLGADLLGIASAISFFFLEGGGLESAPWGKIVRRWLLDMGLAGNFAGPQQPSMIRTSHGGALTRSDSWAMIYMKRENADNWNSRLEKEQILETYSAQLQKS
ncbi:hypothetical protein ZWY2020_037734 [Hordeum vulgare]|nr:hypothetical protein ZWY2020_037734 [Hordeum vulgare]